MLLVNAGRAILAGLTIQARIAESREARTDHSARGPFLRAGKMVLVALAPLAVKACKG